MMDNRNSSPENLVRDNEDEVNLLDLLIVLARHKKMIIGTTLAAAILAAGISLLMPNIYTGTVKILPPQQSQSSASAMLNQLGGLAGLAGSSLGIKNPNDLYVSMLKSRNVMEKVAVRFELMKVYKQESMFNTLQQLESSMNVSSGKDGIITVEVSDADPKRAADLSNAFVDELDKLMKTFALTDSSLKRAFFEQQLKQAKDQLTDAELVLDRTRQTSLQYLDAVRNLKYREAVWEILAKQFEAAKLDEAKDYPLLQILDKASPPERKSKPKRSLIVILTAMVVFLFLLIGIVIRESINSLSPGNAARLRDLRDAFQWRR